MPLSSQSDIVLNAASCKSSTQVTDTNSVSWGQCSCSDNSGCDNNQACQNVTASLKQCYWSLDLANGGKLTKKSGSANSLTVPITPNTQGADDMVVSGKLYAKFSCSVNGSCLSDNSKGTPASLVEFTLQNNNDWYDVSYINGINLPMSMEPVLANTLDYQSDDPYRCMGAGADAATMNNIFAFQKTNSLPSNADLLPFACTNDYSSTYDGTAQTGYNFVSASSQAAACSLTQACTSGLSCGLTLDEVQNGGTNTVCGNRLGYWTYAQLCSANSSYTNSDLSVDCASTSDYAYALCENQSGLADTGPGRSCFNANTTSSGDTCCGYADWQNSAGSSQPMGKGDSAVAGVVTTSWTSAILPSITPVKENCFLAYSYQFDDPYSTFTCATTGQGLNAVSYDLTLCPGGNDAGIDPPTPQACVPQVPAGNNSDDFTVGAPSNITIEIAPCDASGTCGPPNLTPNPAGSPIYQAPSTGTGVFQITATHGSATQTCQFDIPHTDCISPVSPTGSCTAWQVATTGAWSGRSIAVPNFQ
ncbi:MAG: thaumatin family protein [Pseudomonadota bacterium]